MRHLLLFRLGGLGDLLVAFPSIYLLRRALSPCWLSLVCRKDYGQILEETGVIDECISSDDRRLAPFFSNRPRFDEGQSRWLQRFDRILGWMQKERTLRVDSSWLSSHRENSRFFIPENQSQEQLSRFFFQKTKAFLGRNGVRTPDFKKCIRLPLSRCQREEGRGLLKESSADGHTIAVVHPGSGSRKKCWPFRNFLRIIHRLHLNHVPGVMVTGPAEEWIKEEWENRGLPRGWTWMENPSLEKLPGLLAEASFYLGNDSGITHLAAACGTRTLALFRKELELLWRPYGRVTVLSSHSLEEIDTESVWWVINGWLRCGHG
ncbi:MAG: glycosyltransferase family 9 protein [Candidatus Aminicenantales bacterium]